MIFVFSNKGEKIISVLIIFLFLITIISVKFLSISKYLNININPENKCNPLNLYLSTWKNNNHIDPITKLNKDYYDCVK